MTVKQIIDILSEMDEECDVYINFLGNRVLPVVKVSKQLLVPKDDDFEHADNVVVIE